MELGLRGDLLQGKVPLSMAGLVFKLPPNPKRSMALWFPGIPPLTPQGTVRLPGSTAAWTHCPSACRAPSGPSQPLPVSPVSPVLPTTPGCSYQNAPGLVLGGSWPVPAPCPCQVRGTVSPQRWPGCSLCSTPPCPALRSHRSCTRGFPKLRRARGPGSREGSVGPGGGEGRAMPGNRSGPGAGGG